MTRLIGIFVACLLAIAAAPSVAAEKRVALVIGNAAYRNAPPLKNPPSDMRAVAQAFKRLGFEAIDGMDLDKEQMEQKLRLFGRAAEGSDIAAVFYSGHGIQVSGVNYLLPVSANLEEERDLRYEAIRLDDVLAETSGARRLRLLMFDACRDNPFKAKLERSLGTRSTAVGRGLARIEPGASDMLIAYATREDAVARDGEGANSPFTTALLKYLETPGLEVGFLFRKVRDEVVETTAGMQEPAVYGSLGGQEIYLKIDIAVSPAGAVPPGVDPKSVELAIWNSIEHSSDPADFEDYLRRYPNGEFASFATRRLKALGAPAASSPKQAMLPPPRPQASPPVDADEPQPAKDSLAAAVLQKLRERKEYTELVGLYERKKGRDPAWSTTADGQAFGAYLRGLRADAVRTYVAAGDLNYFVGGTELTSTVRTAALANNKQYRSYIADAVAIAIMNSPLSTEVQAILEALKREDSAAR